MRRITVIGATLTGNKGAASMLIALVQNLKKVLIGDYIINCLTIYGENDRQFNSYKNLEIIKCTPFDIVCIAMPLSIFFYLFKWFNLVKKILLKNRVIKIIYNSDLVVNIAGISYSDGRGLILLYNIACDLTPLLLQRKVFKYSQAIGPFKKLSNRVSARIILPKIIKIAARGEETVKNLQGLGLHNYEHCADGAFSMSIDKANITDEMISICDKIKNLDRINIGIAPSSVVEQYCSRLNISYKDLLADFIERMAKEEKFKLVLFPHCALANRKTKKNNDLWIVRGIFEKVSAKKSIMYLDKEYSAEDLRYLISCFDVLITSRYHGMVTALSAEVVPLVIGWSHKYTETLNQFSLAGLCIDYSSLNIDLLENKFLNTINSLQLYKKKISSRLPEVKDASFRNFTIIRELLGP